MPGKIGLIIEKIIDFYCSLATPRWASPIEEALICGTMFCLPLFEAPKNAFGLLFLFVFCWLSISKKSLGRCSPFDFPIVGLVIILWIAPFFSDFGDIITPISSAPRWTLLALFVLIVGRLDYSQPQLNRIWLSLMLGGICAVGESLYVWNLSENEYPEFRSVGHVNHSSMYTIVVYAAAIGACIVHNRWIRVVGCLSLLATLVYMAPSRSIVGAATIISLSCLGLVLATWRPLSLKVITVSIILSISIVGAVLLSPPASEFRDELFFRFTSDNPLSGRDLILNSALAVWDKHPLLGTGWFSFGMATSREAVETALALDGLGYDPETYWHFPHGHNLWTTMLIERGLAGVALVTFLLFLYLKTFWPISTQRVGVDGVARGSALAALLVAFGFIINGLGNTTMMNEHGQAGMAFISVAYGYLRGRGIF